MLINYFPNSSILWHLLEKLCKLRAGSAMSAKAAESIAFSTAGFTSSPFLHSRTNASASSKCFEVTVAST